MRESSFYHVQCEQPFSPYKDLSRGVSIYNYEHEHIYNINLIYSLFMREILNILVIDFIYERHIIFANIVFTGGDDNSSKGMHGDEYHQD